MRLGFHKSRTSRVSIALLSFMAIAICVADGRAELTVVENAGDQQGLTVFKMTVTPAAEPVPALKHRLTLRENKLKPGNAATLYLRAFPEGGIDATWKYLRKEHGEEIDRWYEVTTAISDVPLDKARQAAAQFGTLVDNHVARATERLDCDWGHGIITELRGPDIYGFLLPEIQAMRSISRALVLCTRVAIADHDYDRAIDILRMNYRLGHDVAKSPFLVSGLVGIAICGLGNSQMIELIASPDSPNLYWAMAELPRPLADLRTAFRSEFSFHTAVFPFMDRPEEANHSPEQWAQLLASALQSLEPLSGSGPKLDELGAQLGVTGLALVGYADAKQRLIESGMAATQVEAMPVGQVLAVDAVQEYRRLADEVEKWGYVPAGNADVRENKLEQLLSGGPLEGGIGRALARLLLPALQPARNAEVRIESQLNSLLVIEAVRMHAAETGKLPATLKEIAVVPVPENPVTQQPFQYRLDGATAVLELPFSAVSPSMAWRFEIMLAK